MIKNLFKFVQLAQRIVPKKSTLPILSCVCVEDGFIRVTDIETIIRMPVDDKRKFTLPFSVLKSILKSKPNKLDIDILPNRQIKLIYDGKSVVVKSIDPEDFPLMPEEIFKKLNSWDKATIKALGCMTPFTSNEELKGALRGINIDLGDELTFAATDGHLLRETRLNIKRADKKQEFKGIIPVLPIELIARYAGISTEVSYSKSHIKFSLPSDIEIIIRLIDEKYPPYEEFVNSKKGNSVEFSKDEMTAIITSAKEFCDKTTQRGELIASNGSIELSTKDPERDLSFESSIMSKNRKGEGERTGFNLKYLEKIINSINSERIKWEYGKPVEASYFRGLSEKDEGITNLLMPIRLEDQS